MVYRGGCTDGDPAPNDRLNEWQTYDHEYQMRGPSATQLHIFTRPEARHVSEGAVGFTV
jgi:hypothetical protein